MDERLHKLVQFIFDEHEKDDNMGCEACCEEFAHLSELVARGAHLTDLMPAVEAHLVCCPECREQYDALMCIIRAEMNGMLPSSAHHTQG